MFQAGALFRKVMRVDTTAMEKNIAYPTDIGLLQKSRTRVIRLVQKAKELGVVVPRTLRTFARVSRKAVLSVAKFGRDKKDRVQKAAMGEHTLRLLPGDRKESAPECAEGGVPRPGPNPGNSPDGSADSGTDRNQDEESLPGDPDSGESSQRP